MPGVLCNMGGVHLPLPSLQVGTWRTQVNRLHTAQPAQDWGTERTCATATLAGDHTDAEIALRAPRVNYAMIVTCQRPMERAMGAHVTVINVRHQ